NFTDTVGSVEDTLDGFLDFIESFLLAGNQVEGKVPIETVTAGIDHVFSAILDDVVAGTHQSVGRVHIKARSHVLTQFNQGLVVTKPLFRDVLLRLAGLLLRRIKSENVGDGGGGMIAVLCYNLLDDGFLGRL